MACPVCGSIRIRNNTCQDCAREVVTASEIYGAGVTTDAPWNSDPRDWPTLPRRIT